MGAFIYKPLAYCYIILAGFALTAFRNAGSTTSGSDPVTLSVNKPHPIHVSTINIELNKQDNKFEVICTMFTDDFEDALAKQYHAKTDLSKPDMHAAMDELVKKYVAANLFVKADDAPVKLSYLGYEINREATDVYLESDKMPAVKKVDVEASLIYNLFDDEMNIVHVIVNGTRKSDRVNYPDRKVEQVF